MQAHAQPGDASILGSHGTARRSGRDRRL